MYDITSQYLLEKEKYLNKKCHFSLRERRRLLIKEEILKAALTLFETNGYKKTTMQAIADEAAVGIASIFRIFGNKTSIIASLVEKDLEDIFEEGWKVLLNPPTTLNDTVIELLSALLELLNKPSKNFSLPNYYWPSILVGKPDIDNIIKWADDNTKLMIYGAFYEHKKINNIELSYNISDMVSNIFYIFNGHYINYLSQRDNDKNPSNYNQMINNLKNGLSIIL